MDTFNKLKIVSNALLLLSREFKYYETVSVLSTKIEDMFSVSLYKDILKLLVKIDTASPLINKIATSLEDVLNNLKNYDIDMVVKLVHADITEINPDVKAYKEVIDLVIQDINRDTSDTNALMRSIVVSRGNLQQKLRDLEVIYHIKLASVKVDNMENIRKISTELLTKLEGISSRNSGFKVGVVDEIDIKDHATMEDALNKVKLQSDGSGRLKTGWKELNDMLNGGFIRGETVLTSALQHNYKSGFLRSIFAQVCMLNKPVMTNELKKPLNVFISFEDNTDVITEFFYKYLYYNDNPNVTAIDLTNIDNTEICSYITDKLTSTGYDVKILRVNPSEWSYRDIFTKIMEYESNGYEVHMVVIDYLSKLPTTGCDTTGPMGTAMRDMLTRCRDYFSSKNILFITTHQLSTEAKQLVRNGIKPDDLVKEIANKGYYEGCKQLDQVVDLELHQHIAKTRDGYYLTVSRGKRRYPEIIPDEKRYFKLKFPVSIPCIASNVGDTRSINTTTTTNEIVYDDIPF